MANYVDPEEFRIEILRSKELDELTPRAVEMIQLMAREASKKLKFKDEEDRKDVIAFALMDVIKYWRSFNPEKSKYPFAYYTQIIKNGFAKGWKKLHPIRDINKLSLSNESLHSL
jgi:hypothetical protein